MKILVLGSGAREHALTSCLARDPDVDDLVAAPGNPGMAEVARCVEVPTGIDDPGAVVDLASSEQVDLVVVGPEAPLVAGVADALREAGIAVFGPSRAAAALEGSKAFAKEVMAAAGVPTARAQVCATVAEVERALYACGAPYVVKDDGLAGGKGVVVTPDLEGALAHARACLAKSGGSVVVEEFLDGPEVSLFCVTDGERVVPLAPAQDFKRLLDDDQGPNTGGMGAYSPLDWAPAGLVDHVVEHIARPTVAEMARRGTPFVGLLYVGLALTSTGPRVVEFNARFGDPETQVVLARLQSPLGGLLMSAASGRLDEIDALQWSRGAAVTVVVAAEGYPSTPRTGGTITGLDALPPGSYAVHAGTRLQDGHLVAAGGRVLCLVGTGESVAAARDRAYAAVATVGLSGAQHRTDIAAAAAAAAVTLPSQPDLVGRAAGPTSTL